MTELTSETADALPPVQYLILDVLAARYRTGESCWTFPNTVTFALRKLAELGAIWWKSGTVQGTYLAGLTETGRKAVVDPGYGADLARRQQAEGAPAIVMAVLAWIAAETSVGVRLSNGETYFSDSWELRPDGLLDPGEGERRVLINPDHIATIWPAGDAS